MIIHSLEVTDFRVFQGRHNIDLAPRVKYGKKRPIVLFGGLNGAGKTSILTAIRLGLFGKQSLGYNVSQKAYDDFLAGCIHRAKDQFIQAFTSSISIQFGYANMGILKQYTLKREWMLSNKRMIEKLTLAEDGKALSELSSEQCQGFLNELIPIGVADLFFFDGEKIAELAEDTAGAMLGGAIKKLLGLDLLDTLHGDLNVILRQKSKEAAPVAAKKEIAELEKRLVELEGVIQQEDSAYQQAKPALIEVEQSIEQLERELSAKGGEWSLKRDSEMHRLVILEEKIEHTETRLRDAIADNYPFVLVEEFAHHVLQQLYKEKRQKSQRETAKTIQQHLDKLQATLGVELPASDAIKVHKLIQQEFNNSLHVDVGNVLHDVSDSSLVNIETVLAHAFDKCKREVQEFSELLGRLRDEHEGISRNLERAPMQDVLQSIFDEIKANEAVKTEKSSALAVHLEKRKVALRDAIDVTRQLEKLTEVIQSDGELQRTISYATTIKHLIRDFSVAVTKQKIAELEKAFVDSFSRLARKGDMALKAKIDHKHFSVQLLSQDERPVNKNELSAGEKQIYAIAILEALAKTSGRHLPIIIDTPLGRLDSVHRSHLVNQYFPNASHQVVILSTDTEVDERFYTDLSAHISHAYQLDYDTVSNSTSAKEGYFWKHHAPEMEINHAA